MMKRRICIFLILLFTPLISYAQVGITSFAFLRIQPDARASGMGNTGVALANNSSAIFWNPAGLGYQKGNQINITHAKWAPNFDVGLFYDYLVGSHHIEGIGTFGANFAFFNYGRQTHTDANDNNLGLFNSYAFAIGISYGKKLSDNWAVGTGIRFMHSNLYSGTYAGIGGGQRSSSPASSFGVDIAALYKTDPFKSFAGNKATFRVGLNISNMGPGVRYSNPPENSSDTAKQDTIGAAPLPTTLRIGWAFKTSLGENNSLTLTNDYSKIMARRGDNSIQALFNSWEPIGGETIEGTTQTLSAIQQFRVGIGLEYWYKHLFSVRTGYYFEHPQNGARKFITIGAGIRYHSIGVDISHIFSLRQYGPLANTTRFGLLLNF